MKKIAAVISVCAVIILAVSTVPNAAVSAVPAFETVSAHDVMFSETLTCGGALSFIGQADVTSPLPLVIKQYTVSEGDYVKAGDIIAEIDREGSASYIESVGQLTQLAVAAANIGTAVSLIPEHITADRTGRVVSTAGAGAVVDAGGSIASIAGTDSLAITAAVSEQYISSVSLGQPVTITLAAYPDEKFTGTVQHISGSARNKYVGSVLETVVDVTIAPDKFDTRFKSGLSADVTFTLTEPKKICVLPYEAIGQDEGGEYVYVLDDGKACRRKIFTGAEFSDGTEIIKGVTSSDKVFTKPEVIAESRYIRMESN